MTPAHGHLFLDTSVVIDYPAAAVAAHAETAAVSTITLAELAYGLHTEDPLRNAAREQRYHWISNTFEPIPFSTGAARIYGALCAHGRAVGRDPKPRRFDLLIAAVAVDLGVSTDNPQRERLSKRSPRTDRYRCLITGAVDEPVGNPTAEHYLAE